MNLPLLVRSPDAAARGIACDARVNWADLAPTILDFCDVTPAAAPPIQPGESIGPPAARPSPNPKSLQPVAFHGRSFLGVLEQEHAEGWDEAFASHTFHEITMYFPMRVVIEGDWKLIFNVAHQLPYPFASDLFRSPTWQSVLQRGETMYGVRTVDSYVHRPRFELYDLAADPWETNNLATSSEHQDRLERLQKKLQAWQKDTGDPWELKWRYE
jgi:N-sulfoglucosamine sulfohydrolase